MNPKKLFVPIILFALVGCSTFDKSAHKLGIEYPKELQAVHSLIIEKKTDDARMKIDDYLNKAENIHWHGHAYFLRGFLYEMDSNLEEAIKAYRSAVEQGSQYDSRVEAKALYNLSFVYEKAGRGSELLSTLGDLMERRRFFDSLTGDVETPARLAAAYGAAGRMNQALYFHGKAAHSFNEGVRRASFNAPKEEISKSLYYLGLAVYDAPNESFENLQTKLNHGQKFLLAAAEASNTTWSDRAADRLLSQYEKAWALVQAHAPEGYEEDPEAFAKNKQSRQLAMASDLYDLNHKIRVEEFPMSNVNRRSKKIMVEVSEWISRIEAFAEKLDLGPLMTRNQKIKNKPLTQAEEVPVNVPVNKEKVAEPLVIETIKNKAPATSKKAPKSIGVDPNL